MVTVEFVMKGYGISDQDHSGFAPENLTTLAHFSVSAAMRLPKSAGEPASTSASPPNEGFGELRGVIASVARTWYPYEPDQCKCAA
jgi:hypothetical protein